MGTPSPSTMGRGSAFGKKKEQNLDNLKQELELDVHKVSVDELCKRWNTNVANGLTDDQSKANIEKFGLNQLTPPPTTPKWVKFCKNVCLDSAISCSMPRNTPRDILLTPMRLTSPSMDSDSWDLCP